MKVAIVGDARVQRMVKYMRIGYHLAEVTALLHSPVLVKAYQEFHRLGHFIMLDNGAAEASKVFPDGTVMHSAPPPLFEQVVRIAIRIGADEVIMPDRKKDAEWTLQHTINSSELLPPTMRAIVPQGKDEDEWTQCLEEFDDKLQYNTICVTKDYDRHKLLRWIYDHDYQEYHPIHLLGISAKPDVETELKGYVKEFPWVRGIDSAIAIAYAQHDLFIGNKEAKRPSYQWGHPFNGLAARNNTRLLMEWSYYDAYNN